MSKKGASDKSSSGKKEEKKNVQKSSSYSLFKIIFFTFSVAVGFSSYFVYNVLTTHPELPKVDMNQWWGPYSNETKPDTSVRPFKIEFDDVMINDLRDRLLHTRPFVPPLEDAGFTYGFNSNFLTQVVDYWKNKYNFKERENFFNKYEHFKTKVQGLDIHFMRVKPNVEKGVTVLPLLMLHGWPGSFREFYEIIPKLTTERPGHKFVFEVIVPSLPGFGYSQGAARSGLGPVEIAVVLHNLMQRIGIQNYYIQGGDAGHTIGSAMATLFQDNVLGFHTNTPILFHRMIGVYNLIGSLFPNWVVESPELVPRMFPLTEHLAFTLEESGYMHIQATKPDTIGAALTDSPAGLAAYVLEKYSTWTDRANRRAADGNLLAKFSLAHLLDNVMVYWATSSITTSVRLYKEFVSARSLGMMMDEIPTRVPTACIKFKHELMFLPDAIFRLKFLNYVGSTAVEAGGHFAALEMPEVMADDVFESVEKFLQFHSMDTETETNPEAPIWETATTIFEFTVKDINGREVRLDRYKGHVTIIVNVASQCGLTDTNYKQLNQLYEKYRTRGLRILAFPCNQFGGQEPGSPEEIINFTKDRSVKFDLLEKVEVNGENAHPLWKFLKRTQGGTMGDFIKWNFSKFIINENGVPVERLGPNVNPLDLEPYLAKYLRTETNPEAPIWETATTIFEFTVKDINGREVRLDRYKGHVTIIVNVASQCGLTDINYKQLNQLYEKYRTRGLRILAFPCNQFGGQEPGSPEEIIKFTKDRGVKFDLFEKVEVNGENAHPLWKFLKRTRGGTMGDLIKWNFSKFIINENGVPVERLGPNVNPLDLEPYLAKYL